MSHLTDPEILALARISACIALRDEGKLRAEFQHSLDQGMQLQVIREAVLQTYLFAGYASTINAFILLNDLMRARKNDKAADAFLHEPTQDLDLWKERGEDLCKKIYGSHYEKLIHNMKQLHPDLAEWILWEGYGKVLSRPFLTPAVRELLIVCMTAALRVERQFHSHVRGALNVGAEPEQVRSIVDQLRSFLSEDELLPYFGILTAILGDVE